jgi:hypothetical protein
MVNPHCFRRALLYLFQRPPGRYIKNNDHNRHSIFIAVVGQPSSHTDTKAVYVPLRMTVFVLQMLKMHFIDFSLTVTNGVSNCEITGGRGKTASCTISTHSVTAVQYST